MWRNLFYGLVFYISVLGTTNVIKVDHYRHAEADSAGFSTWTASETKKRLCALITHDV